LGLAGGILPTATLRNIEVRRIEAHEKRTMLKVELPVEGGSEAIEKELLAFKVQDGDEIHIFPIAPYNENGIYLQGHVLRPGRYSFREGMKLTDVISSYNELLPEPAAHYAEIIRLNPPDYHPSVESFDLAAALENSAAAPKLRPLDTVRIFSRYDFAPAPVVSVSGEVRAPGQYRTSGQAHLRDAIYQAGGVSEDAALDSAQLFRMQVDGTMKILSVNLAEALAGNPVDNLLLQPRDRILVNRNLAQVEPPTVYIKGEVAKPGRYPLTSNMRVEDLIRVAGGLKRSAYADSADLTHVYVNDKQRESGEHLEVNLATAMTGDTSHDLPLRNGDVLTIRQLPGWNDLGASITVRGEVQHPGTYGIKPGERLSSVLERAGGFGREAYPYGAVLMRAEVRELEMKSRRELVQRVKAEQTYLKTLPENDADQKNGKLTAIAQTETTLNELQKNLPIGRIVIHIQPNAKNWRDTAADVTVRDGDVLVIPKKANYITVGGQVFNPTAVSYQPGRSAKWYLSQAGGFTALADKKGVFVIRADGSVIAAKNNNSSAWLFSGDPLGEALRPGDSIVVPEKTPRIGGRNWTAVMQTAQVASSLALAVAYIHP
jgi:polysaccharide biosynthesis/export protein